MGFERVYRSDELPLGARKVFRKGPIQVLVLRTEEGLFAVDNLCPHRGGLFSEGEFEKGHIFCPLHAWCFQVSTGEGFFPKGARIKVFNVREKGGFIELDVP